MSFEDSLAPAQARDSAMGEAGKPAGILPQLLSDGPPLLLRISIGLALLYAATILYGVAAGYALPTAAIFFFPHGDLVGRAETNLPLIVLGAGFVSAALGWAAKIQLVPRARLEANEATSVRLLRRWGFVLLCLALVLELTDSAGWNGRFNLNYGSSLSVAGVVPASDANGYFIGPIEEALSGDWGAFASRRPFAAAFRQVTMAAANYSYTGTLLIQAIMIAAALLLAARAMLLWRGLWPATAFCAFVYLLARPFIATVMTEPLALFWALLSTAFIVESFRLKSHEYAFLSLVTLTIAETVRMGSMFTIPAFVIWIAMTFATLWRDRLKLAVIGVAIVAAVLAVQAVCTAVYGDPATDTGGNFAYTLCGLVMGKDWTACPQVYSNEFNRLATEHAQTVFLFRKAAQLVSQTTHPMFSRMYHNAIDFVTGIPGFFLFSFYQHRPLQELAFLIISVPGLFIAWRRRAHGEVWFWLLMFGSMIASALIIFADNGWRVMYATWPFLVLFLSLGVTSPVSPRVAGPPLLSPRAASCVVAALVILSASVPAIARAWPGAELRQIARQSRVEGPGSELIVGRTVTGFIVTPDGSPRLPNVPGVTVTDFRRLARDLNLERDYGKFVNRAVARAPVAFVTAVRLDRPADGWNFYIAPVQILTGQPAEAWRLDIGPHLLDARGRDIIRDVRSIAPVR